MSQQRQEEIKLSEVPQYVYFGEMRSDTGDASRAQIRLRLLTVYSGEAKFISADRSVRVLPNHVALVRQCKGERVESTVEGQQVCCDIGFPSLPEVPLLGALPAVQPLSRRMQMLMEAGLSLNGLTTVTAEALRQNLGRAVILDYALASTQQQSLERPMPEPVRRAREFVDQHYAEPIDLPAIAAAADVTPTHLIRLFRTHLKTTPSRYLWESRVHRGAAMLRDTGITVSEIAAQVGFQSPYHFSRLVKQYYHVSPKKLRSQHWSVLEGANR